MQIMGLRLFVLMLVLGGGCGCGCVLVMGIENNSKNELFVVGESSNYEGYVNEGKRCCTTLFVEGGGVKTHSIGVEKKKLGGEASLKEESGKELSEKASFKEESGKEEPRIRTGLIEKKQQQQQLNKGTYLDEESDVNGLRRNRTYVLLEEKKNLSERPISEQEKLGRNATYELSVYAGEGQFLTVLRTGTPPVSFTAIVDTGSDLVWRQCEPCKQCYHQSATPFPIFNPALSSTYHKASCKDPLCPEAQSYGGTCDRTCEYKTPYDDPPAYTSGDLAFDTLSISGVSGHPQQQVAHFAFGCSHESRGPYNFAGAGGIVGFGQGKLSLPTQLGVKKFSYCFPRITMWSISSLDTKLQSQRQQRPPPSARSLVLPLTARQSSPSRLPRKSNQLSAPRKSHSPSPRSPSFGSPLLLGKDATIGDGPNIQSTRILANSDFTGYSVQLQGISVAGRRLNISRSVFDQGGTIIDSGTTFTTLAPQAFHAVYAAFTALIPLKPSHAGSPRNLSLCYSSLPSPVPSLSFHFKGAHIHLPTSNYFIFIDNLFCLAILESRDYQSQSVYGNVQQQDFHILYDLHTRLISFKPTSCSLRKR